jgi:hypothetical protein
MQTALTNAPRFDYDPATLILSGLLIEETRTNTIPWSEAFNDASWSATAATISANASLAPDNNTTADKLIESATTANHSVEYAPTLLDSTTYNFSIFVQASERSWLALNTVDKAGATSVSYFNLASGSLGTVSVNHLASIKTIRNGWYRLNVRFNANTGGSTPLVAALLATGDGVSNYLGDGISGAFLWGAQLESGDSLTSYIPTVGSALARAADVASVADVSWFNALKGTFYLEVRLPEVSTNRYFMSLRDGGVPDYFQFGLDSSITSFFKLTSSGVTQANVTSTVWSNGNFKKIAARFATNLAAVSVAGGTSASDTTVTLPSGMQTLLLGADQNGNTRLNGHLKSVQFIPHELTKTTIEGMSN